MKKKVYYFAGILSAIFVLYTAVLFVLPIEKTLIFWLSYLLFFICVCAFGAVNLLNITVSKKEEYFNNILSTVTTAFLIVQLVVSVVFMILKNTLVSTLCITYLCIGLLECIIILLIKSYQNRYNCRKEIANNKVCFSENVFKHLRELEAQNENAEINNKLEELQEIVRFGKKESNSNVLHIEMEILKKIETLYIINADVDEVLKLLNEVEILLKRRNVIL